MDEELFINIADDLTGRLKRTMQVQVSLNEMFDALRPIADKPTVYRVVVELVDDKWFDEPVKGTNITLTVLSRKYKTYSEYRIEKDLITEYGSMNGVKQAIAKRCIECIEGEDAYVRVGYVIEIEFKLITQHPAFYQNIEARVIRIGQGKYYSKIKSDNKDFDIYPNPNILNHPEISHDMNNREIISDILSLVDSDPLNYVDIRDILAKYANSEILDTKLSQRASIVSVLMSLKNDGEIDFEERSISNLAASFGGVITTNNYIIRSTRQRQKELEAKKELSKESSSIINAGAGSNVFFNSQLESKDSSHFNIVTNTIPPAKNEAPHKRKINWELILKWLAGLGVLGLGGEALRHYLKSKGLI